MPLPYSRVVLKEGNVRRIEEFEGPPELARFFKAGNLETIPASRADRIAVLRYLALRFEPGREYHESEVNRILQGVHADHAMLRRYLVDVLTYSDERAAWLLEQTELSVADFARFAPQPAFNCGDLAILELQGRTPP